MIRIPNPGSNIAFFIKIYKELYDAFENSQPFSLDDISKVLVDRNLATSSGYTGDAALQISTRADRSRDPLYNQSKAYAELFRMLGWFHPLPNNSLNFKLSYLGAHLVQAYNNPIALFSESIIGTAFPTPILAIQTQCKMRPFSAILLTFDAMDGILSRDEMILGPMCLNDDRDSQSIQNMIKFLKQIRGNYKLLETELAKKSKERKILINTMRNYTRFPLAVLKFCGWTETIDGRSIYNRRLEFQKLTNLGKKQIEIIKNSTDCRSSDFIKLDAIQKKLVTRKCFFDMLQRSNFDLSSINKELLSMESSIKTFFPNMKKNKSLLFSPFQEFDLPSIENCFPEFYSSGATVRTTSASIIQANAPLQKITNSQSQVVFQSAQANINKNTKLKSLITKLEDKYKLKNSIDYAINSLMHDYAATDKTLFYPLISNLFQIIGFDCITSRAGVNYERWDAMIVDNVDSIPIEIKSPGEELHISVKAIRQALENKVILLSRKTFPTKKDSTTLAVGFLLPNNRSEVSDLIRDIANCYNIKIGVIDFESLLKLTYEVLINKMFPTPKSIKELHGYITI